MRFGGLAAVDDVSLVVAAGEFCGIIGPNGAGKTTLFNAISGLVPLESGEIRLGNVSLGSMRPSEIGRAGIARTFQHLGVFSSLSVEENIAMGDICAQPMGVCRDILALPGARAHRQRTHSRVQEIARICGLSDSLAANAGTLPFGLQKRVEIARALACMPSVLLLDEPAGGLSHREVDEFLDTILKVKEAFGLTVIMIEHHLGLVMKACEHVIVLNFGRKIADGSPGEIKADREVIAAYLGTTA